MLFCDNEGVGIDLRDIGKQLDTHLLGHLRIHSLIFFKKKFLLDMMDQHVDDTNYFHLHSINHKWKNL